MQNNYPLAIFCNPHFTPICNKGCYGKTTVPEHPPNFVDVNSYSWCCNGCRNEHRNTWSTAAFWSTTLPLVNIYAPPVNIPVPCYQRSTLVAGPSLLEKRMIYNTLPDDLRDPSCSVDDFRQMLKTALFTRYYTI